MMSLNREEIELIARSTAQTVLEGLHRYAVDYVAPLTVAQGLRDSMIEEATAAAWYRKRATATSTDPKTAEIYEHVSDEEAHHYQEFKERLQEIAPDISPPSNGHHKGPEESGSLYQPPDSRAKKCDFPGCDKWARYYGKEGGVTRYLCTLHFKEVYKVPNW